MDNGHKYRGGELILKTCMYSRIERVISLVNCYRVAQGLKKRDMPGVLFRWEGPRDTEFHTSEPKKIIVLYWSPVRHFRLANQEG
jgi:hypothetical protein